MPLPAEPHSFSVDRFEGAYAVVVLPDGASADVPRWLLPAGTREGDVVRMQRERSEAAPVLVLRVDAAEGERLRNESLRLRNRLRRASEPPDGMA